MKKQAFNPYLPLNTYIPDGEPHVFGDRVYIYGSHDAEGGDCFCLLTNGHMPHLSNAKKNKYAPNVNHEGDIRFVKDVENGTMLGYKYFSFWGAAGIIIKSRGSGGRILIMTEPGKPLSEIGLRETKDWVTSDMVTFHAQGNLPLYLCYQGKGKIDLLEFTLSEGEA